MRAVPLLLAILLVGISAAAQAQRPVQSARGELLYSTHCLACHSAQIHWRDRKVVTDWASLKAQVRRWAANTSLGWSDDEIADVARFLNATIYRFPAAAGTELGGRNLLPTT